MQVATGVQCMYTAPAYKGINTDTQDTADWSLVECADYCRTRPELGNLPGISSGLRFSYNPLNRPADRCKCEVASDLPGVARCGAPCYGKECGVFDDSYYRDTVRPP